MIETEFTNQNAKDKEASRVCNEPQHEINQDVKQIEDLKKAVTFK
jgi:hypothetical protein